MSKPPYHLAFILTSFARGGMEMRLADIVNGLDKTRWNPHVYAFYDHLTMRDAIEPHRLHTPLTATRRDPLLPFKLARIFRQEKTVVAWSLTQGLAAAWGRIGGLLGGVPIRVVSFHDVFPIAPLTRLLTPITNVYVTNSHFSAESAIRQGIPRTKLHVLPNGINTQKYHLGADERVNLFGISPDRPVILHVGRLESAIKGQDILLRAIQPLMNQPNPPLTIFVGEGIFTERAELEKLAQELGVAEHVRFMGIRDDIPALMRSANVLVMCSRTESSPNVVLEAQACGLPVIAAEVGGTPELFQPEQTGILIPPDNPTALTQALTRLLTQPDLAHQMGQVGRVWVETHFSLERMLQGRIDLFERWLARQKESRFW